MEAQRKSTIEQVVEKRAADRNKPYSTQITGRYNLYKAMIAEILSLLRSEDLADDTLFDIKKAFNDITNGFQDLRGKKNFNTIANRIGNVEKVVELLKKVNANLKFAVAELEEKGKTREHFSALEDCREDVFQIKQQLDE